MKKSDLHREWARVIDMCEGTEVKPRECLRIEDAPCHLKHPTFGDNPEYYTFAVSILEGKPLFVGDEVYWKDPGEQFDWNKGLLENAEDYQEQLTRTPPARTIMLNGEKLPAPEGSSGFALYITGAGFTRYVFQSSKARDSVEDAINKLLKGD